MRDHLGQDLDLFLDARPSAEEDVDHLLEIEQPERQLQVLRVEHLGAVVERAAVFVVRIDQEDAQCRPRIQNPAQQQGDAARLADAGRAEHGEMLAHHLVDIDVGADRGVLLQLSDIDRGRPGGIEDQAEFVLGHEVGVVADHRIVRDAALEIGAPALPRPDFSHEVGLRHAMGWASVPCRLDRHLGDDADDQRLAGEDAEELADRGAGVMLVRRPAGKGEPHRRQGAADGEHVAERRRAFGPQPVLLVIDRQPHSSAPPVP